MPSKALEGFARTNGVEVKDVYTIKTPKGEYVAVKKTVGGRGAGDILADVCPGIISGVPFAKRMRWGTSSFTYARPMHWILALLDDSVVSFEVGPVKSGRTTRGHRIHGAGPFEVPSASDYVDVVTKKGGLVLDGAERRRIIIEGADRQAKAVGGRVLYTEGLLNEVCGLVEHPVPLLGDFDKIYLEVPREVLVTSMQVNQKSFGLEDSAGNLLPHFVTVLNLTPPDVELVKHGWERVLRARLEDARFFWHEDLKNSFDKWLEELEHVVFIRGLGTMGDKTRRLEKLCRAIAEKCDPAVADNAARAGRLSKADLVTNMVGEFDTLQGVMGGIYAKRMGENDAVASAVSEQYLPAGPDSPLPVSATGAILSIADKVDTMAGCFGLGLIPTGAADPNALRRCALGIIRIVREFGFSLDMRDLVCARPGSLWRYRMEAFPHGSPGQAYGLLQPEAAQLLPEPWQGDDAGRRSPRRRRARREDLRPAPGSARRIPQGTLAIPRPCRRSNAWPTSSASSLTAGRESPLCGVNRCSRKSPRRSSPMCWTRCCPNWITSGTARTTRAFSPR